MQAKNIKQIINQLYEYAVKYLFGYGAQSFLSHCYKQTQRHNRAV